MDASCRRAAPRVQTGRVREGKGEGSGGGFGGVAWPLGVYVVRDGTVRWVPAIDVTRLVLSAGALVRALTRARRRRRD